MAGYYFSTLDYLNVAMYQVPEQSGMQDGLALYQGNFVLLSIGRLNLEFLCW